MKNRRDFLKTSLLGAGVLSSGVLNALAFKTDTEQSLPQSYYPSDDQVFNMCGYAAPKMKKVRVGIVGIGDRGSGAVERMTFIDGVEITALCDIRQAAVDGAQEILKKAGLPKAKEFVGGDEEFRKLCEYHKVDLVYTATPWEFHVPIALAAMENDKHAAIEVPAAKTLDQCWQLVETSERTRKHCVMLENCCYDFFELLTLNMVRNGVFGELIHGEGAYIHNLDYWMFNKPDDSKMVDGAYTRMWRLYENERKANVYPTHGLGPICQAMNINRGDKMDYLVAMITDDFSFKQRVKEKAAEDPFYEQFLDLDLRGNMDIQLIRTNKGRSIMIQHDVTSPRPYSRIHMLSGTKCFAQKWPVKQIAFGHKVLDEEEMTEIEEKYTPELVRKVGEIAKEVGGHGGMDFIMDWRLIDNLRNGLPMDMDVYDAAAWSCITPLSEWSIANKSQPVDVPDFTRGAWKTNKPVDTRVFEGGTTGTRSVNKRKASGQMGEK